MSVLLRVIFAISDVIVPISVSPSMLTPKNVKNLFKISFLHEHKTILNSKWIAKVARLRDVLIISFMGDLELQSLIKIFSDELQKKYKNQIGYN